MQNFNFHTHTYRCKHAIGRDEEYVIEAIKAGVKVLGFSDHMPFRNVSLGKMST
ncbi:MAG: PHP domain-containing protein [Anaerorhabdus sp.]